MLTYQIKEVAGIRPAFEGMRYAFKSGEKSDLENDLQLLQKLNQAGNPHNKLFRQIVAWVIIRAPLYWWKQADTYRMGFEKNSESTMHTVTKKPFEPEDFGWTKDDLYDRISDDDYETGYRLVPNFRHSIIETLNTYRHMYLMSRIQETKDYYWNLIIQILPESYMQARMCMISYATLQKMWFERKNHKLPEWRQLLEMLDELPLGELIKGQLVDFVFLTDKIRGFIDDLDDYRMQLGYKETDESLYEGYGNQNIYPYLIEMKTILDTLIFSKVELSEDLSDSMIRTLGALRDDLNAIFLKEDKNG